jgi:hypothetical protein
MPQPPAEILQPVLPFKKIEQGEPKEVYKDIVENFSIGRLNTMQAEALQTWVREMMKIYPPRNPDGTLIIGDK